MEKRKVSVILPTYNRAYIIKNSIRSILDQTYKDYELIIVDDGSTDETENVINEINDDRIIYHKFVANSGVCAARNYGIEVSKGEYIAFQDSDDIWIADKLERQMKLFEFDEQLDFVYSKLRYKIDDTHSMILPDERISYDNKIGNIYNQLLWDNLIPFSSLVVKKNRLNAVGKMDNSFSALEDYDFVLRIAKNYKAGFVDEVLVEAAISSDGISSNSYNYLVSSCKLLGKYKNDYIKTGMFNHRVEIILQDAQKVGIYEQILKMLELVLV